jgi:hypothetical protein
MAPITQQDQQYQQGVAMPVTQKYMQVRPDAFRETISETWQATKPIVDTVAEQVEQQLITPVQGAAVVSAITGSLFGFTEFHRELRPADLAQLLVGGNGLRQ